MDNDFHNNFFGKIVVKIFVVCKGLYRQASNTLSLRKCMNISPFSVWALISRSSIQRLTISPILFDETPLWLKQLPVSLFGQARFVERQSHCSYLIEQYTGLNWQCGTIDKPGTSLFQQYTIQSACNTHPILLVSTILDFWTPNFKATAISTFTVHLLWKFTKWLKTFGKMLCAVLWKCCLQFWNYAPLKVVLFFLDHPIYLVHGITCRGRLLYS